MQPKIILGCGSGYHNENFDEAVERLKTAKVYQNLSTVILTPTRGLIPAQVVQSWMFLLGPANSRIGKLFSHVKEPSAEELEGKNSYLVMCQGFEVGSAYDHGITTILNDPIMSDARYVLTLEDDNIPPHDGLLKLFENICDCEVPCKEHFTVIGGLYWMKGEMGQPMLFGKPEEPGSMVPQIPVKDGIQEVNGTGMGFTLFHMGLFRELEGLDKPWFVTEQLVVDPKTVKSYTQDLYFMERLRQLGYRIAVDTRVKVGHFDLELEHIW